MLKKMEMMNNKGGMVSIEKRRGGGTKLYYSLFYAALHQEKPPNPQGVSSCLRKFITYKHG